jgi:hypothetical protein
VAKDRIDFSGVPQEIRRGGGGGHLPEGDHLVKIAKVEKRWKDDDRSNIPYYNWHLQAVDGQNKGTTVYHRTSLKPDALFSLRNLIHAVKGKNVAGKAINFDPTSFIGEKLGITVQDREYKPQGKEARMTSEIVDTFPASELEDEESDQDEEEVEEEEEEEEEEEDLEEVDLDEL